MDFQIRHAPHRESESAMNDQTGRTILDDVYHRLSERIEGTTVNAHQLKQAALEALAHAKERIEQDPEWLERQLARLNDEQVRPLPPAPESNPGAVSAEKV
jgi:hypothetical protein